jgi:hypothetical protein
MQVRRVEHEMLCCLFLLGHRREENGRRKVGASGDLTTFAYNRCRCNEGTSSLGTNVNV